MGESLQTSSKRARARVNGELVQEPKQSRVRTVSETDFDRDIEWLLTCAASALGERGNTGSVIATIKRGTTDTGGIPNTDLYTDQQVGWGGGVGDVERARRLYAIWHRVPDKHQRVLMARYETRGEWPPGVESNLGVLAGLALFTHPDPAKLITACGNISEGDNKAISDGAIERAKRHNRAAHEAWREARRARYREWADGQEGRS